LYWSSADDLYVDLFQGLLKRLILNFIGQIKKRILVIDIQSSNNLKQLKKQFEAKNIEALWLYLDGNSLKPIKRF
jgi:hypothetical protein